MELYSPFFQTLHDERSPTGHLGNGTHASILRAVVFHGPTLVPLSIGAFANFAVIWDEDHDTRVIKAVENIYRAGFLGSILMIGERQGTLNAVVSERVQDPKVLLVLEDKLRAVAEKLEGDPWSSSLHRLDSPDHEIIEDENAKVSLYLANLNMLWRLGAQVSAADRIRAKRAASRKSTLSHLTDEQMVAILRSIPGAGDDVEVARVEALLNAAEQMKAKKEKEPVTGEKSEDKPRLSMREAALRAQNKIRLVDS